MNDQQRPSPGSSYTGPGTEQHAFLKPMPSLTGGISTDFGSGPAASAGSAPKPASSPEQSTASPRADASSPATDSQPYRTGAPSYSAGRTRSSFAQAPADHASAAPAGQPAARGGKAGGDTSRKSGAKKKESSSLSARLIKRYFMRLTLLTTMLMIILCGFSYSRNNNIAMMRITLNYEEANKGMAPNLVRLNMYDIISDDLLSTVLQTSDMGVRSPSALRRCLNLRSTGSGAGDYISTEYILTADLYDSGIQTDAFSLLGLIQQEYTKRFYKKYIGDTSKLFATFLDASTLEYPELVDYYNARLSIIRRFTSSRAQSLKSFRSETTGQTYVDITEMVDHLINIDLEQLDSFVKQTGIIKNANLYLSKLNYQIYSKSADYERQFQFYGTYTDAIQKYNILQTAVVMVPTYDANGQFYMSMTKTGVDDIALTAQNWNEQSAETRRQIDNIKELVQNVQANGESSPSDLADAEAMLKTIDDKLNQIIQLILQMDSEFRSYRYKDPITFSMTGLSTSDRIEFKTNLIICAAFYLVLWLIVGRREFRRSRAGGL